MPDQMELLLEGERRGILPQDKLDLLQEGRRRGFVPPPLEGASAAAPTAPQPAEASSQSWTEQEPFPLINRIARNTTRILPAGIIPEAVRVLAQRPWNWTPEQRKAELAGYREQERGLAQGAIDPAMGLAQLNLHAYGDVTGSERINQAKDYVDRLIAAREAQYQAGRRDTGETDIDRITGNIASPITLATGEAGGAAQGANMLMRLLAPIRTGALMGAEQPVTDTGDYWGTKGEQTAGGGAGGGALHMAIGAPSFLARNAYAMGRGVSRFFQSLSPEEATLRDVALRRLGDRLEQAGTTPEAIRDAIVPPTSANLQRRGFGREGIADIISRGMAGEPATTIAADYNLNPRTVAAYLDRYRTRNPTPMNMIDLTKEIAGEGAAQPVTRFARSMGGISEAPEPIQRLLERQLEQPGRATNIIQRVAPGQDFETQVAQLSQQAETLARQRYGALHARPDLVVDQSLSDVMTTPLARKHWESARTLAEAEGYDMPSYDEMARTFGQRPRGGLGLDPQTGQPQPPAQYPVAAGAQPGAIIPVRALDYFQRALRLDAEQGGTMGHALNALRQRFLTAEENIPRAAGEPSIRETASQYRAGMVGQEALQSGAAMTTKLGAPAREALADFNTMTPPQRDLFRIGFARKLMDMIGNKQAGAGVTNQFSGRGTQEMIRHIFEPADAETLIRNMQREGITTRTFQDITAGSRTAPMSKDMAEELANLRGAADLVTGRPAGMMKTIADRLTYQMGRRQGAAALDVATQTDPARLLPDLNRMVEHRQQSQAAQNFLRSIATRVPATVPAALAGVMQGPGFDDKPKSVREWRAQEGASGGR